MIHSRLLTWIVLLLLVLILPTVARRDIGAPAAAAENAAVNGVDVGVERFDLILYPDTARSLKDIVTGIDPPPPTKAAWVPHSSVSAAWMRGHGHI